MASPVYYILYTSYICYDVLYTIYVPTRPDRTFHHVTASKYVNVCGSETSVVGCYGSKIVKCWVG